MMYLIGYVWDENISDWCNIEDNDWNYIHVTRIDAAKRYSYNEAQLGILFLTRGLAASVSDHFVIIPEDLLCFTG